MNKPTIYPPAMMTQDELDAFRASRGIATKTPQPDHNDAAEHAQYLVDSFSDEIPSDGDCHDGNLARAYLAQSTYIENLELALRAITAEMLAEAAQENSDGEPWDSINAWAVRIRALLGGAK